jgi:hypothetical protein
MAGGDGVIRDYREVDVLIPEAARKVDAAKADALRNGLPFPSGPVVARPNGHPPVEVQYEPVEDAPWSDEPAIGGRPREVVAEARQALRAMSWDNLMSQPPTPPPMLRPGVPEVGLTVLAGAPKVGKTLYACQQALLCGKPALLVIEEGSLGGIAYRLRRQAESLELTAPPITVLHRQRVRLDDKRSMRELRAWVADMRPALVEFDPLNRLHGADENRPSQMTPVMDAMAGIAYDYGCAVLAVHHLAKPSERGGSIWDRYRGATSIRSGTDANLALDGTGDRVRLVGEFRDADPLSMYLELDRDSLLFGPGEAPDIPAKVDPVALRAFVEERRQVNARQVMDQFSVSKHTALAALRALGCDEYPGPRGAIVFTLGGGQ